MNKVVADLTPLFTLEGRDVYEGDELHVDPAFHRQAGARVEAYRAADGSDVVRCRSASGAVPLVPLHALSWQPFPETVVRESLVRGGLRSPSAGHLQAYEIGRKEAVDSAARLRAEADRAILTLQAALIDLRSDNACEARARIEHLLQLFGAPVDESHCDAEAFFQAGLSGQAAAAAPAKNSLAANQVAVEEARALDETIKRAFEDAYISWHAYLAPVVRRLILADRARQSAVGPHPRLGAWLASHDTGVSSESMAAIYLGARDGHFDAPRDAGDFGRCFRLLAAVPEVRTAFPRIQRLVPSFAGIIEQWDELADLYQRGEEAYDAFSKRLDSARRSPSAGAEQFMD